MILYLTSNILAFVASLILVPMYSAVLVRVRRGTKFKAVTAMSALMLVSNIATMLIAVTQYFEFGKPDMGSFLPILWMQSFLFPIQDLTFGEAHWFCACYYFKAAKSIPRTILKQEVTVIGWHNTAFWAGVVFNALFPIMEGVFGTLYFHNPKHP